MVAGDERDAGLAHEGFGGAFAAHGADGGRGRADEGESGGGAGFGEIGVFGEEAVAGVDGVGARGVGGGDDVVGAEIAVAGGGEADVVGFVGEGNVEGVLVGVGIDGDGAQAHAAGGADDPAGDFAAVGRPGGCGGAWRSGVGVGLWALTPALSRGRERGRFLGLLGCAVVAGGCFGFGAFWGWVGLAFGPSPRLSPAGGRGGGYIRNRPKPPASAWAGVQGWAGVLLAAARARARAVRVSSGAMTPSSQRRAEA